MFIYQFSGTGHGFMSGVHEYIRMTLDEIPEGEMEDYIAPGFTFDGMYDTELADDDEYTSLPLDTNLVNKEGLG